MQEPTRNEIPVDQNNYLEYAVAIIRRYLDAHGSFTAELLQLTAEQDVETLSKNLGALAKKCNMQMDKLEAFLRNKDYLTDYPAQKAEREEKAASLRANLNNFFQPFRESTANTQVNAPGNEIVSHLPSNARK